MFEGKKKKERNENHPFSKARLRVCESEKGVVGVESLSCPLLEWEGPRQGMWEKEGWVCHLECVEEEPSGEALRDST